jgi:hypothetical protein
MIAASPTRREHVTLVASRHPSLSFAAARRVHRALATEPVEAMVTAVKLVAESVESLTRSSESTAISVAVTTDDTLIRVTIDAPRSDSAGEPRIDGLARLLLERLSRNWGEDPIAGRVWFEISRRAVGPA